MALGLPKPQRPAAAALAWSRMLATSFARCTRPIRVCKMLSSCRSASFPITWKCCTISTPRREQLCDELGINMVRAGTVGTHPRFVRMIRELDRRAHDEAPTALGARHAWSEATMIARRTAACTRRAGRGRTTDMAQAMTQLL